MTESAHRKAALLIGIRVKYALHPAAISAGLGTGSISILRSEGPAASSPVP
jgi:hypothetical protein